MPCQVGRAALALSLVLGACQGRDRPAPAAALPSATPEPRSLLAQAHALLARGEAEAAAAAFRRAAEAGVIEAQYALGVLAALGHGMPASREEALRWYEAAAERAGAAAQYNLARCYDDGLPPRAPEAASSWIEGLARLGEPTSPLSVGADYTLGPSGLEPDPARALDWYVRAADLGHEMAAYRLAQAYQSGRGVPPDAVRAHMWLSLCAEHGLGDAATRARLLGGALTPAELARSAHLLRAFKERPPGRLRSVQDLERLGAEDSG